MGFFGGILGLIALICAIWVIYEIVTKHKKMKDIEKLIWIVCAVIFNVITAIIYYLTKYKHK